MASCSYPFVRYQYEDGSVDPRGHACLPVSLTNPASGSSAIAWGILDTGADACLLPGTLARDLGHDLTGEGVKCSVTSGIEQTPVTTYKHSFRMQLLSADLKRTVWQSGDVEVDCAETSLPVILGVEELLRHFKITIDYPNEKIALRW